MLKRFWVVVDGRTEQRERVSLMPERLGYIVEFGAVLRYELKTTG